MKSDEYGPVLCATCNAFFDLSGDGPQHAVDLASVMCPDPLATSAEIIQLNIRDWMRLAPYLECKENSSETFRFRHHSRKPYGTPAIVASLTKKPGTITHNPWAYPDDLQVTLKSQTTQAHVCLEYWNMFSPPKARFVGRNRYKKTAWITAEPIHFVNGAWKT